MEHKITVMMNIDDAFLGSIDYYFDDLDEDTKAAIRDACSDAGEHFIGQMFQED